MHVLEFNNNFNHMLNKFSKEQKQILLLGDLNTNLLNYNVQHQPNMIFLTYEPLKKPHFPHFFQHTFQWDNIWESNCYYF